MKNEKKRTNFLKMLNLYCNTKSKPFNSKEHLENTKLKVKGKE